MGFWVGIDTLGGGVIFFRRGLKSPGIINSEYKSQAEEMIPIVTCTISQFWSPTLTNLL